MSINVKKHIEKIITSNESYTTSRGEGGELGVLKEIISHRKSGLIALGIAFVLTIIEAVFAFTHSPEELESLGVATSVTSLPWLATQIGPSVPFLLGFVTLGAIFFGVVIFQKWLFKIIASVSSFTFSVTLFGFVAAWIIWFANPEYLNKGTARIETFAGGVNYTIALVYCFLSLFVSVGFYNSNNTSSWPLTLTSLLMLGLSWKFGFGSDFEAFQTFILFATAISIFAIAMLFGGIYLGLDAQSSIREKLRVARLKTYNTTFNNVLFGCIGLGAVIPLFLLLGWVSYKYQFDTIEFICMKKDSWHYLKQFATECTLLGH